MSTAADTNPFSAERAEPASSEEVAKSSWSTQTAAVAAAGATTGQNIGFALGAVPGIAVGAASGSLVGCAVRSLVGPCCAATRPGKEGGQEAGAAASGVCSEPETAGGGGGEKPPAEASKEEPAPPALDSYMVTVKEAGGASALHGAEVGGTISGVLFSLPGALIGGMVGGIVGVCLDIRDYFKTPKEEAAAKEA